MNFLVSLLLGILRIVLPALLAARPTCEKADPQPDLGNKLQQKIRRHWGVCVLLVALAGCGPKTVYVPSGTPVRLRETVKNVKVWVKTEAGIEASVMDLPEGWYCLELTDDEH